MAELVSILIAAYNAEKYIGETIRSALEQTWPNKEIIIVDDGSSDNTLKIAKSFESKILKVVTQKNMGACSGRNKAVSLAQGNYIQFLDADDLLAADKISQQMKGVDNGARSSILLTSAFGKFFFCHQRAKFRADSLWQDLAPVDWIIKKFTDNVWMNPAAWLVSRRLMEDAGPWDERLSVDNDGEYLCRVVAKSERIKFINAARSYYRIGNVNTLSWKRSEKALRSHFLAECLCIEHLRALEESERTRIACVKYLQDNLVYFYPEEKELVNKSRDLARSLGGNLVAPLESLRFSLIRKMFGLNNAKKIRWKFNAVKLLGLKSWDKLLKDLYYT